jgi:ParB/RepB/Spo0J family partition protein
VTRQVSNNCRHSPLETKNSNIVLGHFYEKEYMTESLSPHAKAHLANLIFDPEEGLGSLELPDNPAIAVELRTWLVEKFGAEPYLVREDTSFHDESEEGEEIDLLEQFVIEPENVQAFVNAVTATSSDDTNDEIVFHDRDQVQKEKFATKDGKKLNLLKCKETREIVAYSDITIEPNNNPRKKTQRRGLVGLAISISKTGLRHDIGVRPHPTETDKYLVIYGYRRFLAIAYAIEQGWLKASYQVGVRLIHCNENQALLYALEENNGREDVDPLDQAEAFAELRLQYTLPALATANGMSEAALEAQILLAANASPEAKALYRQGLFNFEQLKALCTGSLARQKEFLNTQIHASTMRPEYIVRMMLQNEFRMSYALFKLEDYIAVGGEYEANLFFAEAGRLTSIGLVRQLQLKALETKRADFLTQGYKEVLIFEDRQAVPRSDFIRASQQVPLEERAVVMCLEADLSVIIEKDLVRTQVLEDNMDDTEDAQTNEASSNSGQSNVQSNPSATTPPPPTLQLTERAAQMARRYKSSALQAALMNQGNHHLITALAIYSLLDSTHSLVTKRSLNASDELINPLLITALEQWTNRLPSVGFSKTQGIRATHNAGLELLCALIELSQADLDELLQLLIATSFGDWNVSPGSYGSSSKENPVAVVLASHLNISGTEAWQPNKEYLTAIGFNKPALKPYLDVLFGSAVAAQLLQSSTKAGLVDEVLKKANLLGAWVPPELAFGKSGIELKPNLSGTQPIITDEAPFIPTVSFEREFTSGVAAD